MHPGSAFELSIINLAASMKFATFSDLTNTLAVIILLVRESATGATAGGAATSGCLGVQAAAIISMAVITGIISFLIGSRFLVLISNILRRVKLNL
jgi:hypothetical protein